MNQRTKFFLSPIIAFVSVALLSPIPVHADWINLSGAENAPTIAEIYINDDHIKVILEIYVHDLKTFIDLIPDDFFQDKEIQLPPVDVRLRRFSSEVFQFITQDGEHLQAELLVTEPRIRKERPSPFAGVINPMHSRLLRKHNV